MGKSIFDLSLFLNKQKLLWPPPQSLLKLACPPPVRPLLTLFPRRGMNGTFTFENRYYRRFSSPCSGPPHISAAWILPDTSRERWLAGTLCRSRTLIFCAKIGEGKARRLNVDIFLLVPSSSEESEPRAIAVIGARMW